MSVLDNKKKLKDTVEGYANTILKYKTSNKPNKFNSSSNELKKDYKKLTKLRKDLNDLDDLEDLDDDKEKKQFVKQVSLSVANTIKEYEEVLVENGESIMDPGLLSPGVPPESEAGSSISSATLTSGKMSKKEQRKLMKEKKNQMKMQAKLAQQEAFNNKQIMITERSAKDVVIEVREEEEEEEESSGEEETANVRVEHVPKTRRSEEKEKKKKPASKQSTPSHDREASSPHHIKPADLTKELLNKPKNPVSASSQGQTHQVEWGELAAQRKQRDEAAQRAAAVAEKQQLESANPSVLLTAQLPQLFAKMADKPDTGKCLYDGGQEVAFDIDSEHVIFGFPDHEEHLEKKHTDLSGLGLPCGLEFLMEDYLAAKADFATTNQSKGGPWFDFKTLTGESKERSEELSRNRGSATGDHGIVITGRRQEIEIDTSQKESTLHLTTVPRNSFVRCFVEEC